MTFTSLASSSHGNAYLVEDGKTKLLLECGVRFRELEKKSGFGISGIEGCLITHEHSDHSRSVRGVLEAGVPVYASEGTAAALGHGEITILEAKKTVAIGSYTILPFPVCHDAAEPFGYLICSGRERLLFATDTSNLQYTFPHLTQVAVECNHDKAAIARENLEPWRERALRSHMDIDRLCEYLGKLDMTAVRAIYLLHLSDRYADEDQFVRRIEASFGIPVTVCAK